mmetsp:Transcript_1025/g.1012  ORF Transcript_1025/g.1012 Transcript_1025/m.1012 type:complete len:110 (-) Transcript_1025:201-530(-)
MESFPADVNFKRVLSLYIKDTTQERSSEPIYFALFEGGYLVSFKLELFEDEMLSYFFILDDDITDFLLPTIIAIIASGFLLYRRRRVYVPDNQQQILLQRGREFGPNRP